MTKPNNLHIEEATYRDMAEVLCPKRGHTKLARSVVEFIVDETTLGNHPHADIATLRNFVEFLIKNKGYN